MLSSNEIILDEPNKPSIPIIDFSQFTEDNSSSKRKKIAEELVSACRDVGFVYIINHGVSEEEISGAFTISKKFFDLPSEQKLKAPHPSGWEIHRGYSWPGLEKVSNMKSVKDDEDEDVVTKLRQTQDFKESYEIGSDHNPGVPNVWLPDDILPEFRPFMTKFYWKCFEIAKKILKALALGIGLKDEDYLLNLHSGHCNQLRLLHYPPIPAKDVEDGKFARMPAHTDWSTLTMLFQDDVGGLQVEDPNLSGKFIDVSPMKNSLVMNVGDLLMRWSNDYLKSTSHRVSLPPLQDRFTGDERLTQARYSIPYFVTTDPDLVIECLRIDDQHPPKYDPITQREYSAMRARMQY